MSAIRRRMYQEGSMQEWQPEHYITGALLDSVSECPSSGVNVLPMPVVGNKTATVKAVVLYVDMIINELLAGELK